MGHDQSRVGQVGDLDPSLVKSRNLSRLDRSDPPTHVDRSEISTSPGQNDKLNCEAQMQSLCSLKGAFHSLYLVVSCRSLYLISGKEFLLKIEIEASYLKWFLDHHRHKIIS